MYSKFCRITVSNNSNLEICYKPMIIDDFCDSYGIIYIYSLDDFIHTFKEKHRIINWLFLIINCR